MSTSDKKPIKHDVSTQKKPFKCESCDYHCYLKGELQKHVATVHEGKKPFNCESCDDSLNLKGNLSQDIASVHKGKKPFKCKFCDYCCDQKSDLQKHAASVHEGKKPFKCKSCDYCAVQQDVLQQHVALVHGEKNPEIQKSVYQSTEHLSRDLNILTINVRGIECNGRIEQVRLLLVKCQISLAVLSETETLHSFAASANMDGFKALCHPLSVTGPCGKEAGVMIMISDELASVSKLRHDINGTDTVQTIWIELLNHDFIIGGIYRRARPSDPELEKAEFTQIHNQILKAANTGKSVLLLGDTNIDHTNPAHKKNEAKDLLTILEAKNMRRLPTGPTWKSYGLHKTCLCDVKQDLIRSACGCPKQQRVSTIDNVYLSLCHSAKVCVLQDAISDHFPILVQLNVPKSGTTTRLKTIWRHDLKRLSTLKLEDALEKKDWSTIYSLNDPNKAVSFLLEKIVETLNEVAPLKAVKFRPDKPILSLRPDTLNTMAMRDKARMAGNSAFFKLLRNKATKFIKRDKIQGVMSRLRKNPGHQQAWHEAKTFLGRGRGQKLPVCTINFNPNTTAEYQNRYFADKIQKLVASLPKKNLLKCHSCDYNCDKDDNLQQHVASVHEGKKPFRCERVYTWTTALSGHGC